MASVWASENVDRALCVLDRPSQARRDSADQGAVGTENGPFSLRGPAPCRTPSWGLSWILLLTGVGWGGRLLLGPCGHVLLTQPYCMGHGFRVRLVIFLFLVLLVLEKSEGERF